MNGRGFFQPEEVTHMDSTFPEPTPNAIAYLYHRTEDTCGVIYGVTAVTSIAHAETLAHLVKNTGRVVWVGIVSRDYSDAIYNPKMPAMPIEEVPGYLRRNVGLIR